MTTMVPSADACTSHSTTPPPNANPSRNPSIVFSGTTLAPPRWAKLIGQPRGVGGFGIASPFAVRRPTAAVTSVPASAPRMKEAAPRRISQMLSATMGESPRCLMIALLMLEPFPASTGAVQSRGTQNAGDTHLGFDNRVEIANHTRPHLNAVARPGLALRSRHALNGEFRVLGI